MKAMLLKKTCDLSQDQSPLEAAELPCPSPAENEILVRIRCCGVCHTELDEIEGRTPPPYFPVVPGHQVIGVVADRGRDAKRFRSGDRVGIAWIYEACGKCEYCQNGMENLCAAFKATGRDVNGGYAEFMTVPEKFAFVIPPVFADAEAAPLLCAGAIGYRSLQLTNLKNGQTLGLSGFGASGHLVLMMCKNLFPDSAIVVFARSPDERSFALSLKAHWAGAFGDTPPLQPHAIIDTTPAWNPIVESLRLLKPGGRLVINAIRKEETDKDKLLHLDYPAHLWMEKEIKSVANITRRDVEEFLALAARIPIRPEVEQYPLADANRALLDLKHRHVRGAKVLMIDTSSYGS